MRLLLDYNVVEAFALAAVMFSPGAGLWEVARAAWRWFARRRKGAETEIAVQEADRRDLIAGLAAVPVAAAFGGAFVAKHGLDAFAKKEGAEAQTSASYRFKYQSVADLKKPFDKKGKIKGVEFSRVIMGGNLIGGWGHARDLKYVSTLMKAYNTPRRIFDTLHLGEACGFDTILTNPSLMNFITRYWKEEGGKIKFISDCGHPKGPAEGARVSVDNGACMVYVHGFGVDKYAVQNDWKGLERELKEMRKLGVPVGIGAHAFGSLKFCIEHDLIPDFWMKTPARANLARRSTAGATTAGAAIPRRSPPGSPTVRSRGSPSRRWPPARSIRRRRCRSPSTMARTSSAWACSTSRWWRTPTSRTRCSTRVLRSARVRGAAEETSR